MRISVFFTDRVGIAQEILAILARRVLDVSAVEVDPPHIFFEAPALTATGLPALREELQQVLGVQLVAELEMLPGARRRLYLDALLASQADPVLAVDARGVVVVATGWLALLRCELPQDIYKKVGTLCCCCAHALLLCQAVLSAESKNNPTAPTMPRRSCCPPLSP